MLFSSQIGQVAHNPRSVFACRLYSVTGILCPGCGGTRSMLALLRGDLITALHDNPASPVIMLVAILYYFENLLEVFGKNVKLFPRNVWFWMILLGLHLVWSVVRNFVPAMQPY